LKKISGKIFRVAHCQSQEPSVTSAKKDCNPIKFKKANFLQLAFLMFTISN
jgi:hypothetical protein